MYAIDPELHERLMNMKDEDFCILVTPDSPEDRKSDDRPGEEES